jgi:hypothetical protein
LNTLDLDYRQFAAILTLSVGIFLLIKYPAGNCLLGFSTSGLGAEQFFGRFSYAQCVVVIQAATLVVVLVRTLGQNKVKAPLLLLKRGATVFMWVILLVWCKIGFDSMYYGLNEFRISALKTAIYTILLPGTIAFFSLVNWGVAATMRGWVVGLCAISFVYLAPVAYPILVENRLISAATGETRLTVYGLDTINGGRMFFFGSVGFLLAGATIRVANNLRFVFFALGLFFFILSLLNGTRQFVFSILLGFVAVVFILSRTREMIAVISLMAVASTAYVARDFYSQAQVVDRVTTQDLTEEIMSGRGRIWLEAWNQALESPVTGIGFRNYGMEYFTLSEETGDIVFNKETAHGFFQEIFVEHGLLLGFATLGAWLWSLWQFFGHRGAQLSRMQRFTFVLCLVFCIPESFSAAVFNSLGFHFFAIASLALHAEETSKTSVQDKPVPNRRLARMQPS